LACSRNTILREIVDPGEKETIPRNRDRKAGGGRKQVIEKQADINEVLLSILKEHTACFAR
jgi:hypothetical protein